MAGREWALVLSGAVADVLLLLAVSSVVAAVEQALEGALGVGAVGGAAAVEALVLGKNQHGAHSEQNNPVLKHFR